MEEKTYTLKHNGNAFIFKDNATLREVEISDKVAKSESTQIDVAVDESAAIALQ